MSNINNPETSQEKDVFMKKQKRTYLYNIFFKIDILTNLKQLDQDTIRKEITILYKIYPNDLV